MAARNLELHINNGSNYNDIVYLKSSVYWIDGLLGSNGKITEALLPNSVFGGARLIDVITADTSTSALTTAVLNYIDTYGGTSIGCYFMVAGLPTGAVDKGTWNSGTTYVANDVVLYSSKYYYANNSIGNLNHAPSGTTSNTEYWNYYGTSADFNITITSLENNEENYSFSNNTVVESGDWVVATETNVTILYANREAWDSTVTYGVGEYVTYNGYTYVVNSSLNNLNKTPSGTTSSTEYWTYFVPSITFKVINNTYSLVTTTTAGVMSPQDKIKLNGLSNYIHPSYTARNIDTSGVDVIDTLVSDAYGHITSIATRTLPNATTGAAGVMSATDKTKLDGIASGANLYVHPTSGANTTLTLDGDEKIAAITVDSYGHVTAVSKENVQSASTTVKGLIELATNEEMLNGTDAVRASTPAGVKAAINFFGGIPQYASLALANADVANHAANSLALITV